MGVSTYRGLLSHVGHKIVCVSYGGGENIAIECETCNEVLMDFNYETEEQERERRIRGACYLNNQKTRFGG